jgi:signal transduction histidine kinase
MIAGGGPWLAWALLASVLLVLALILLWWQQRRLRACARQLQMHALEQHEAVRIRAASEERERIFRNLHDDLGAKLLQLIYSANSPEQADLARAVLQDVRDVVTRSRGAPGSLLEVLGEIRSEAEQRLRSVEIALDWQQPDDLPDPALDEGQSLHLFRIVREAISNVIRHARAHAIRVRMVSDSRVLRLELIDDGIGPHSGQSASGRGKDNMRARARQLDGDITWKGGTAGGTKVLLSFPLPVPPAAPQLHP